jgi:flagellin-like protein
MSPSDSLLRRSDRGATPVIGIILLVALAVILSSVTLVFALGVSEDVDEPMPSAGFEVEIGNGTITLIHTSGDDLDGDKLSVSNARNVWIPETVGAGDRIVIEPDLDSETVSLNYRDEDSSATLQTVNVENVGKPAVRLVTADGRLIGEGTTYDGFDERPLVEVTTDAGSSWDVSMVEQGGDGIGPASINPGNTFDPDGGSGNWDDDIPTAGKIIDIVRDDASNSIELIIEAR